MNKRSDIKEDLALPNRVKGSRIYPTGRECLSMVKMKGNGVKNPRGAHLFIEIFL